MMAINWFRSSIVRRGYASISTSIASLKSKIPGNIAVQLKSDLNEKQLTKCVRMIERGVNPLPQHWLKTSRVYEAGTKLPKPGALEGSSIPLRKTGGRNHHGKITVRHRGGGFKRRIRIIDRSRQELMEVKRIEHDPNRSGKIALVQKKESGELAYVLASESMTVGTVIDNISQKPGCTLALKDIAVGTEIHNIEFTPGFGGQLVRSAGTYALLVGKDPDGKYATVRLPSGCSKKILVRCRATIGRVGNADWQNRVIGKAGRTRNLGRRPKVRGVAMNAVDHPHGGGKGGRSKGKPSQSIWGWVCK